MINSIELLIPESLRENLLIQESFVAKIGCVRLRTTKKLTDAEYAGQLISEIFSLIYKSPYIMEVIPPKLPEPENCKIPFVMWSDDDLITLHDLKADLRVSLPKRKQMELIAGSPFEPMCPEQFTILFRGFLFLAYSKIETIGEIQIGQMARELLEETLSKSSLLQDIDRLNPTPLLPEIFFIQVKNKQDDSANISEVSFIHQVEGNLVIIDSRPIKQVMNSFFESVESPIMSYYESRIIISYHENEIINLSKLRHHMSKLLVKHLQLGNIKRFFSKTSDEIRKTLGDIHLSMQNISLLELKLQRISQIASRDLNESYFLRNFTNLLNPIHIADLKYDYSIDARIIEFASEETTNSTIAQITLISAFAGALVGGLLTMLIQFFSK